jgi:hypothetical protein
LEPGEDLRALKNLAGLVHVEERRQGCRLTVIDTDGSVLQNVKALVSGTAEVEELDSLEEAFVAFTAERRKRFLDLTGGEKRQ